MYHSNIKRLPLIKRGKVRDLYAVDSKHLLMVATDRLSAFDVVLPEPIPGKGVVLTAMSNFWFAKTRHIIANHLNEKTLQQILPDEAERALVADRSVVVSKLDPLPVEAIVRGYLAGSGWRDYQKTGNLCGIALPRGLQQAEQLPEPIYTPSTKASPGEHDKNIDFAATVELLGRELAEKLRETSLRLYRETAAYALERGIIIADTKFEFGTDRSGQLRLIDEVLTPDSTRFWLSADTGQAGIKPIGFDKQMIRDYLETLGWDKNTPPPKLPKTLIRRVTDSYQAIFTRLTKNNPGCLN